MFHFVLFLEQVEKPSSYSRLKLKLNYQIQKGKTFSKFKNISGVSFSFPDLISLPSNIQYTNFLVLD